MTTNFNGFNEKVLTFECDTEINAGTPVKITANGKVAACSAGDRFVGICVNTRGGYATVQVEGFVSVSYTGTAPAINVTKLVADGNGGVKADSANGGEVVAVCVDTTAKTIGFIM